MRIDNRPHDGQSNTETLTFRGEEGFEDSRQLVVRNTNARVGHHHLDAPFATLGSYYHVATVFRLWCHSLQAVEQEIEQHLLQVNSVTRRIR
jgi:hypothetical protein